VKFDRVKLADDDTFLGRHGAYVEKLYVAHETNSFAIRAGKFTANFGLAWDDGSGCGAAGLYGRDFVESYETSEAIGLGGRFNYIDDRVWGLHAISGDLFFLDNTSLSNSVMARPNPGAFLTDRPRRTRFADGGAGNNRWPQSYVIALEGSEIYDLPGLKYHLAYRQLQRGTTVGSAANDGRAKDQRAWLASAQYAFELAERWILTPMFEIARISGIDLGAEDLNDNPLFSRQTFVTVGAKLDIREFTLRPRDQWILSASHSYIRQSHVGGEPEDPAHNDRLLTASVEYRFDWGLGLGVGWRRTKAEIEAFRPERHGRTDTLGAAVTYQFEF
jgi:hypothetical protein